MRGPQAERLRRRCAAITAAAVFVSCLLLLLGLAVVVFTALGIAALLAVALVAHTRGWDSAALERSRRLVRNTQNDDAEATVEMAAVTPTTADRTVYGRAPLPTRAQLAAVSRELLRKLQRPSPSAPSRSRLEVEGSRCNALGVELRRAGRAQQAATLHEAARVIYAGVGDSRGEALAANALGVALVELGEQDAALEQFEQARTLLHELGDRHWEGKVLANAGLAKHRIGRNDEAVDLMRSALGKLSPETEAYRVVEQRLERAS